MVLNTRGLGYINEGVIDRIKEVGKGRASAYGSMYWSRK